MALIDDHALARVWEKIKAMFVAKESGKGLSSNDYTTAEKNKLAGIATGANAYTHPAYTARTGKPTGDYELGFGESLIISQVTSDATGHVTGMTDREIIMPYETATDLTDGLMSAADKDKLDAIPSVVGVFARNISDIEAEQQTIHQMQEGIMEALAAANVRALNAPNLLKKDIGGVEVAVPSGDVITETITIPAEDATAAAETLTYTVENEAITASMVLHGKKSSAPDVTDWQTITGVADAGSMTVSVGARSGAHSGAVTVTLYICNTTTAVLPYGDASRWHGSSMPFIESFRGSNYTGEEQDEISERIVTLTGTDIIDDTDGESYDKAIAFTVASVPTSGMWNSDDFVFYYGSDGGTATREVDDGNGGTTTETYTYQPHGIISEMVDDETYTLSCFARITSGTKARLVFKYGHKYYGYVTGREGMNQFSKEISNTTWERIAWSFVYHSTDSAGNVDNWKKRVSFGVCRTYAGTVQLAGFRLTKNGLYGDNTVDTLSAEVAEARATNAQNTAQVATVTSQMNSLLASVAPVEASTTASANYSAGELLVLNGKLYKASTAIVTGDTLTVGTNITATTLAAELAALNA